MIQQAFRCDGCPSIKAESNGWFVLLPYMKSSTLLHWKDASESEVASGKHFCGSACALKAISEWIGGNNVQSSTGV